ncbi:3-deoxy-D-manno-octulosonic acid kinase [Vibrio gallaecicus]|uniref:3-deoxy-D-manno-octulosonic acid kinase n=1 Tax=Vibrio gallaecicus TaxID=552386 RepID=UPI0010C9F356|nr:3-deoxy-D-manno-octulosonic acid kinase [Vibrio gallaecicus]MDN3614777.1 3-deoxy-D-manno-octulosonic acid kinase [Vibrio gallaecicus]
MKQIIKKDQAIWFDEALVKEPIERVFDAEYWHQEGKVIGSAQGRGTTWFIQTELIAAALRHYRRGGLFGKIVKDNYWFTGWERTRSHQEFMLLKRLDEAGVNVPKPLAARALKTGVFYRADLLSEKIANAQDLVAVLEKNSLSSDVYRTIGAQVAQMHAAQVNHTDLNIHNILLDSACKVWIIDFDKCSQQTGDEWKTKNLSRLKRSFIKEVGKRQIHWQESEFAHLLAGYDDFLAAQSASKES